MDAGGLDPLLGLGELMRLRQPNLSKLFTQATGTLDLSFLKKNALEQEVQSDQRRSASTVHSQFRAEGR